MFGSPQKPDPKQEAERQAMERAKEACREILDNMKNAAPEEAEKLHQRLKDSWGKDKYLPYEYKKQMFERARTLECNANMRAADSCLHRALKLAADENMMERTKKLADGRRYTAKAQMLGAGKEWRLAADRLIENIMLTGGVHKPGPSRAKPLDTAPKNPHSAKG
jgi:hypothetical protein